MIRPCVQAEYLAVQIPLAEWGRAAGPADRPILRAEDASQFPVSDRGMPLPEGLEQGIAQQAVVMLPGVRNALGQGQLGGRLERLSGVERDKASRRLRP